jgi:lysophospholipase
MPDTLMVGPVDRPAQAASLAERFLTPPGFGWGRFATADGAGLRYGCLAAVSARADCVLVGGFGEFIEMHFETARDLATCGLSVWCLEWRGQGRSARPGRWPSRPRPRNFDRDADELAEFAAARLTGNRPRVLIAHSMGGAIALLCLHRHPGLFDAAVMSAPMFGLRTGRVPPRLLRSVTAPLRFGGLAAGFIPGLPHWRMDRVPSPATSRASSDPERCRLRHAWMAAEPELRLGCPTYGWLDAALALVARIGRPEFLAGIATPILLGIAGRDVVVATNALYRAARILPDCTVAELAESRHQPFLERDEIRDKWIEWIDRFVTRRIRGAAPP